MRNGLPGAADQNQRVVVAVLASHRVAAEDGPAPQRPEAVLLPGHQHRAAVGP